MIEEALGYFGGVGVLAAVLFAQNKKLMEKQDKREKRLAEVVENNTAVMARFLENQKKICR